MENSLNSSLENHFPEEQEKAASRSLLATTAILVKIPI